jgi:hypothetical protein
MSEIPTSANQLLLWVMKADTAWVSSRCVLTSNLKFRSSTGRTRKRPAFFLMTPATPSAPLGTAGQCTDAAAADCGLVDFVNRNSVSMNSVHWINNDPTAAAFFGTPDAEAGRNILRGQPISTANLAVFKNINLNEKFKLQFQAQAFNVMNVQFLSVPDPVLNDVGSFRSTKFNSNGGLAFAGNLTRMVSHDAVCCLA